MKSPTLKIAKHNKYENAQNLYQKLYPVQYSEIEKVINSLNRF